MYIHYVVSLRADNFYLYFLDVLILLKKIFQRKKKVCEESLHPTYGLWPTRLTPKFSIFFEHHIKYIESSHFVSQQYYLWARHIIYLPKIQPRTYFWLHITHPFLCCLRFQRCTNEIIIKNKLWPTTTSFFTTILMMICHGYLHCNFYRANISKMQQDNQWFLNICSFYLELFNALLHLPQQLTYVLLVVCVMM